MTTSNKKIVGIIGEMASGKTTVSDYIKEKYGAQTFRFSDMLGDILDRLYLDRTRGNYQTLSTALRQSFSEDLMSKVLVEDLRRADSDVVVTEGIRRPTDVTFLRELPNFKMIALNVDTRTRYDRLTARTEKVDDQQKTWEEFEKENSAESEQEIANIAKAADHTIDNTGSIEDLHKQIDEILANW